MFLEVQKGMFGYNDELNGLNFSHTDTGLIKSTRHVGNLDK